MGIKIIGTGSYVPEKILTNFDIEKMVDTTDEWIRERSGITERRVAADDQATSDLATIAAQNAMSMANIEADELDLIVVATVTEDMSFPSTACIIQNNIKAVNAVCFDIHAACTGFIYGLDIVTSMMSSGRYNKAMLIGAEKLTTITDYEDRSTNFLFGDAAGAIIFSNTDDSKNCLLGSSLRSDGSFKDILNMPGGGSRVPIRENNVSDRLHYLKMDGPKVFKLAVNTMVKVSTEAIVAADVTVDELRWIIPHQANLRIINGVGKRLKVSTDKVFINVDKFGNSSSATTILSLDQLVRSGKVESGDKILLTAFGAGLTSGAAVLEW